MRLTRSLSRNQATVTSYSVVVASSDGTSAVPEVFVDDSLPSGVSFQNSHTSGSPSATLTVAVEAGQRAHLGMWTGGGF